MKASLQGYTKAGVLGLLAGLAIVALGAFVVTGRVDAEDSETVLSDEVVGPAERDPSITRAIGGPLGLDGPGDADDAEAAMPPAGDDDEQSADSTDPVADDGDTDDVATVETTTTLPQVIVDPDLFDDDEDDADETGDDGTNGDAEAPDDTEIEDEPDGAGDDTTPTRTSTTTTTTTTTSTTTTTTTTTVAQSELAEEMDRILELFPPELEGLLIEIAVFDDQLSFGVASEADADELDAFLTDVTDAPYSIRLATR